MTDPGTHPVLFEERRADNGVRAGVARLNAEKPLNSLSLEMIDLLFERLSAWAADPASHSWSWRRPARRRFAQVPTFTNFTAPWCSIMRRPSATIFEATPTHSRSSPGSTGS